MPSATVPTSWRSVPCHPRHSLSGVDSDGGDRSRGRWTQDGTLWNACTWGPGRRRRPRPPWPPALPPQAHGPASAHPGPIFVTNGTWSGHPGPCTPLPWHESPAPITPRTGAMLSPPPARCSLAAATRFAVAGRACSGYWPYDRRSCSLIRTLSRNRRWPSLLCEGGESGVNNVQRSRHPCPSGWISNRIVSLGRSVHSEDQMTSVGSALSRILRSTSSSSRSNHWRADGSRGWTNEDQTTLAGAGCGRCRLPSSVTSITIRSPGGTPVRLKGARGRRRPVPSWPRLSPLTLPGRHGGPPARLADTKCPRS